MRLAFVAVSVLTILACSSGTGLARCDDVTGGGVVCARLGEELDVRIGETAYIADTRLSVRAVGVPEDSRCPRDAICVWAGNARVSLALRDGSNSDDVELNSTLEPRSVSRWGYVVQLIDVKPTPTAGERIPAPEYVLRLLVKRASG